MKSEPMIETRKNMARPSKFQPAYCDLVIEHMAEGASLTSFAAEIGVARSTINEWMEAHSDFADSVRIAKAKCAAWWEKRGRELAVEGGGNAALVMFGLKNMGADDWREKQEVEQRTTVEAADPLTALLAHIAEHGKRVHDR
jgi:hypothetical protein